MRPIDADDDIARVVATVDSLPGVVIDDDDGDSDDTGEEDGG
jgi:hypothetical protein